MGNKNWHALQQVSLSPSDADSLIWAPSKSGSFSVKSATMELAKANPDPDFGFTNKLWKGLVPLRIKIFSWLVLLEKINSKVKLAKIGLIPPFETLCVLCSQSQEDVNPLFLHCPFSHKVWAWWLQLWSVDWIFPSNIWLAFEQWQSPFHGPFIRKVWCAIFLSQYGLYGRRETRGALLKSNAMLSRFRI